MIELYELHNELKKRLVIAKERFDEFEKQNGYRYKFTTYYKNPEFRKRHLAYMSEKVECQCGFMTARNNMTRHKRSRNHQKRMMELSSKTLE